MTTAPKIPVAVKSLARGQWPQKCAWKDSWIIADFDASPGHTWDLLQAPFLQGAHRVLGAVAPLGRKGQAEESQGRYGSANYLTSLILFPQQLVKASIILSLWEILGSEKLHDASSHPPSQ